MNHTFSFIGGRQGAWEVTSTQTVVGAPLEPVQRVSMVSSPGVALVGEAAWVLRGFTSNLRYAERREVELLREKQEGLNRPDARCAALIPIRKKPEWWALSQDERRDIFEEQSRHTAIGMDYLPGIARQLHHCRDLGEPFDFLTWFEFAPEHTPAFNQLLEQLRASVEWSYVDREVDIRLSRP